GSIIPLPDVPTSVERGGDWTLQRLALEVAPRRQSSGADDAASFDAAGAEVLLETQIDALDITILRGGAHDVGAWALENGFFLTPYESGVLEFYAKRSLNDTHDPFEATRAAELGEQSGDGTPIMLTIPSDARWVALGILRLGLPAAQHVQAD